MHIEIETEDLIPDQLTSRKDGRIFYTLDQPALMFTDQSKYPVQFKIRHAFTENRDERDKFGPIRKGLYMLNDGAYRVGRFGSLELVDINIKHLKPVQKTQGA